MAETGFFGYRYISAESFGRHNGRNDGRKASGRSLFGATLNFEVVNRFDSQLEMAQL